MSEQRILKVTGTGHATAAPDRVTISFALAFDSVDYGSCVEMLNRRTAELRASLTDFDIPASAFITTNFNVSVKTKYQNGENRFVGFTASHQLAIKLPFSQDLLNGVMRKIAKSKTGAEVSLAFLVKDKAALREKSMAAAVEDAKKSARILAESAGVQLGSLWRIDFGSNDCRFELRQATVVFDSEGDTPPSDVDVNPEDISATSTVTLEYEIL